MQFAGEANSIRGDKWGQKTQQGKLIWSHSLNVNVYTEVSLPPI